MRAPAAAARVEAVAKRLPVARAVARRPPANGRAAMRALPTCPARMCAAPTCAARICAPPLRATWNDRETPAMATMTAKAPGVAPAAVAAASPVASATTATRAGFERQKRNNDKQRAGHARAGRDQRPPLITWPSSRRGQPPSAGICPETRRLRHVPSLAPLQGADLPSLSADETPILPSGFNVARARRAARGAEGPHRRNTAAHRDN
jgi:hypothetical protein